MKRLKYAFRWFVVNLFRKIPKQKYKLTRFYKSKTRYLSYLFVFSCFIAIPAQFLFYFSSSYYYLSTTFLDRIEATTPEEQAKEFSKYNELFTYSFKDGFLDKFFKSHYYLQDPYLLFKSSKTPYEIESHGLLKYKIHGQEINIHTMKVNGIEVIAGIPKDIFNQCLLESYHYNEGIPFINRCSRIFFATLSVIKYDPNSDKVLLKDGKTIEIIYSDGKTFNIAYGDKDYVRKFFIRSRSDQ